MKKLYNVPERSSLTGDLFILIGISAVGCNIFSSSLFNNLNNNNTLMTLSPPPVEPAQAPTKLIKINTVTIKLGHDSNVVLVKPEVVMNDTV